MNKLIGQFVLAMVFTVGITALSNAAGEMAAPGPQSIKGDACGARVPFAG